MHYTPILGIVDPKKREIVSKPFDKAVVCGTQNEMHKMKEINTSNHQLIKFGCLGSKYLYFESPLLGLTLK